VSDLPVLDHAALPEIAELCRRGVRDALSVDELDGALFAPDQPAIVRGDPATGVVATVTGDGKAYIRLLVVDPAARGHGHGHELIRIAHADARASGNTSITVGTDAPYFLWPGVPSAELAMLCLLERHHYARVETNFDMTIDLRTLPDDPGGHTLATAADRDDIEAFADTHWSNWKAEVLRALDKGNLVIARDREGIAAFCAFEVNRRGFLGPVASRPDLIGHGAGRAPLLGALHELRARGRSSVDVSWVGPIVPYARVGGHVSSVYFVYRKALT
jgi:GNAT superfamily N-acetyltransferase